MGQRRGQRSFNISRLLSVVNSFKLFNGSRAIKALSHKPFLLFFLEPKTINFRLEVGHIGVLALKKKKIACCWLELQHRQIFCKDLLEGYFSWDSLSSCLEKMKTNIWLLLTWTPTQKDFLQRSTQGVLQFRQPFLLLGKDEKNKSINVISFNWFYQFLLRWSVLIGVISFNWCN